MKKISILLSLFVGIFMANVPAQAVDVSDWSGTGTVTGLKQALEDETVSEINFTNNITIEDTISPEIRGNKIINGNNNILDGNKNMGFTVGSSGMTSNIIMTINNVVFENFSNDVTPAEKPLMIKAKVINRDIGFIKIGMPVSIKIDTFDFQKYGILHGTISSISQNSIEDKDLGLIYEVYIKPTEDTLLIDNKEQKISTGMTLNAEIEIGKRRIIEFFIYPLIKYLDEGISVR